MAPSTGRSAFACGTRSKENREGKRANREEEKLRAEGGPGGGEVNWRTTEDTGGRRVQRRRTAGGRLLLSRPPSGMFSSCSAAALGALCPCQEDAAWAAVMGVTAPA